MQTDNKKPSQGSGKTHSSDMDWREKLDCILDPERKGRDSDANMTEEEMDEWIDRYAPDDKKKGDKGEEEQERELNELSRRLTAKLSARLGFDLEEEEDDGQTDKERKPKTEEPVPEIPELVPFEKETEERIPRIAAIRCENSSKWVHIARWAGGIAAAVVFGIIGLHWLDDYHMNRRTASAGMEALCKQDTAFLLSDGTEIMMQGGTELTASSDFGKDSRRVSINGQGFMHAATDSLRPYIVDMPHDVSLEVRGTAFNINAYSDNPVCEITVSSGCVEIMKSSTGRSYGLFRKGDRFTYNFETGEIVRSKADLSRLMAWKDRHFSLHRATVEEFKQEVFRVYGKTVYIRGNAFKPGVSIECRMEFVEHPSLETVLTQVCASQKAVYRIQGSRVYIYPANNI